MAKVIKPGSLLVADASTNAGFFTHAVVLIIDIDETGALGIVLNKVSNIDLNRVLPLWRDLTNPPQYLFSGGPVSPDGAVCLAVANSTETSPLGWRRISGDLGLLHLDTPVELVEGAYQQLRIFAGYSGWGPGQLEDEIENEMWQIVQSHPGDIFTAKPEELWRNVLRRQGGSLGIMASWTADPQMN